MLLSIEEQRKFFAFFLKYLGIEPKFKKTEYGYCTYNTRSQFKLFIQKNKIVRHRTVKVWNGYEYENKLEEKAYIIERLEDCIRANLISLGLIG